MTDEERQQRIHHHMYETCEGIAEHAERIVKLEELCADMWMCICEGEWDCLYCPRRDKCIDGISEFGYRMDELGIPRGQ